MIRSRVGSFIAAAPGMALVSALDPASLKDPDVAYNLGVQLLNAGRPAEAATFFSQSIALDARYVDGYFRRGLAEINLGKTAEAKADLLKVLPYTPMQFDSMVTQFNWDAVEKPVATKERWVMRSYRMPADAAEVLDDAIKKVQAEDSCPDWQAIERLAADFLSGD